MTIFLQMRARSKISGPPPISKADDDDDDFYKKIWCEMKNVVWTIQSLHCCVGHTAWAPEGREGRSQAGPKGQKPAQRAAN